MNALLWKALVMFGLMFGLSGTDTPPADTPLQQQWQSAYAEAAQRMLGVVEETQAQLQFQAQTMTKSQGELPEPAEEAFAYMNGYLNRLHQDLEEGVTDPLAFRARLSPNRSEDAPPQPDMVPGDGNGTCDGEDCEPVGDGNHYGQDNGGQNGDGECDNDCTPVGDENHYGQDNGGQNGDGDGEPVGDQNQNGKPGQ